MLRTVTPVERYLDLYFDLYFGLNKKTVYADWLACAVFSFYPIKFGLNWYAFCNNNPVTFIDPSGMKPWEYFSTRDKAAKDFGFYIGQKSIDVEEEFASYIFEIEEEDGRVYYFYDVPRNDLESHEERSISFSISWDGTYGTLVAVTHTHGAYDADTENLKEGFSSTGNTASGVDEMSDAYWSDKNNIDYYVITPSGKMSLYVANSGNYSGELISSNMLVDSRIQIYQHMRNTLLWGLLQSNFKKGTAQDYVNARRNNPDSLSDTIKELEKFR